LAPWIAAALLAAGLGWYLGGRLSAFYQAEVEARRRSELQREFLEKLIAASPIAVAVLRGPRHLVEAANRPLRDLRPDRELIGRPFGEIFPELASGELGEGLDHTLETGIELTATEQPITRGLPIENDEPSYFTIVTARIQGESTANDGVVVLALETTTEVLNRRRADREREDFLSTLGHELKTPLAALSLSVQVVARLARSESPNRQRLERYATGVESQIARASRLIGELLEVARTGVDVAPTRREPVDLLQVVTAAVARERDSRPDDFDHPFTVDVPTDPLVVLGDATRLDHVVTNLLSNAVKYSPAGGSIHVRLVAENEAIARLLVSDDGIGIPEGEGSQLFEPFSRTAEARRRGIGGTGLGLYITRKIVEGHGGTIRAEGREGGGSTFVVSLPLAGATPLAARLRRGAG
jgi:signal transduction histidine kinase